MSQWHIKIEQEMRGMSSEPFQGVGITAGAPPFPFPWNPEELGGPSSQYLK